MHTQPPIHGAGCEPPEFCRHMEAGVFLGTPSVPRQPAELTRSNLAAGPNPDRTTPPPFTAGPWLFPPPTAPGGVGAATSPRSEQTTRHFCFLFLLSR